MAYPTNNSYLDGWIRSVVRSLRDHVDTHLLVQVFGPQIQDILQDGIERVYGEAFYGDFHHPEHILIPYTTPLMHLLPFELLLQNVNAAGSCRSWMDLRQLVKHPEFSRETVHILYQMFPEDYNHSVLLEINNLYNQRFQLRGRPKHQVCPPILL
jgi:hypothetical protein